MNPIPETPHEPAPRPGPPHPDWSAFETALAGTLAVLEDEFLILSVKGSGRYVQLHVSSSGDARVETVSNDWLRGPHQLDGNQVAALLALGWVLPPPDPDEATPRPPSNFVRTYPGPCACTEIARLVVRTFADVHQVPGPAGLEYRAFGAPGSKVFLPALQLDRTAEPETKVRPPAARRRASPMDRLRRKVLRAAREATGLGSLEYDQNGWLTVPVGERSGFIQAHERPTYVRVHLHLRSGLEPDPAVLARLHEVNGRLPLARLVYASGNVYLGVDFPAEPFVPAHLQQAITTLGWMADGVEKDVDGCADAEGREKPAAAAN